MPASKNAQMVLLAARMRSAATRSSGVIGPVAMGGAPSSAAMSSRWVRIDERWRSASLLGSVSRRTLGMATAAYIMIEAMRRATGGNIGTKVQDISQLLNLTFSELALGSGERAGGYRRVKAAE